MRIRLFVTSCLISFFLFSSALAKVMPVEFDTGRNRLIAYMISHQLSAQHFAHEPFDDKLSQAAFDLYIKQLDPRKRFLLTSDVAQLSKFATTIDDELSRGRITLPDVGMQLMTTRVTEIQGIVDGIMDSGFDPNLEEYLETDAKKRKHPATIAELQERWRLTLKLEVLDSYLEAVEETNKKREKDNKPLLEQTPVDKDSWDVAMSKVRKKTHNYLKRLLQITRQEYYNNFFDVVARAFDPHTGYMAPTSKEDFDIHMRGSLEGIGALLRQEDGHIKVVRIIPGSAAEAQGQLQAEDVIMAVSEKDGEAVDISAMRIREAVSYIRGPKGTEVRLTVTRADGSRLVIPIVRDVVKLEETYVKSTVLKDAAGSKIGYIRIPSFYRDFAANRNGEKSRNVTDDTRSELHTLKEKGISGLILDLRNNGGGSLADAIDVSGLFLSEGPMVQVKNSQGMIRVLEDEDKNIVYNGPMIVLVNQFSASASEILAGAMQDYGRALIVGGAHTHGKGTVQTLLDMNRNLPLLHLKKYDDLGHIKLTIQKFYRINGGSTQYKGIVPDLVLPSMLDHLETGEQYMDNSLPWDKVTGVDYTAWNGARFDVKAARQQGEKYAAADKKFQKIKEESLKAKQRKEETMTADYLAGVIREREELERAREEARAAGVLDEHEDDEEKDSKGNKKKKDLDEQLAGDPYVDLALFLMNSPGVSQQAVSRAK